MKLLEKENRFLNILPKRTLSRMRTSCIIRAMDVRVLVKRFCFFPYGEMQTDNLPEYVEVIYSLRIFAEKCRRIYLQNMISPVSPPWGLCLLGDLHFNHRYGDTNCYYPGSPVNTTFDRDENREYGVDIYEFVDSSNYAREFYNLDLPKLIRRTIKAGETMTTDARHHVVYEVKGNIDELSKIERTELLDKKVVEKPSDDSTLDLKGKTIYEELEIYLKHIKVRT